MTYCLDAGAGYYVDYDGATYQTPCPPGTYTGLALTYCDGCERDYYWDSPLWERYGEAKLKQSASGDDQCARCCVSCLDEADHPKGYPGYRGIGSEGTKCSRTVSEERGGDENTTDKTVTGVRLETIRVAKGWWRTNKFAQKVYECDMGPAACRGGFDKQYEEGMLNETNSSTYVYPKWGCAEGHTGVLCGTCWTR